MKRKRSEAEANSSPSPAVVNGNGNKSDKNKKLKKAGKIVNASKKKKVSKAESRRKVEANAYYVVPWCDSSDWDKVCTNFNKGRYDAVIQELTMWRERVPALPIGAESTLFLLQALVFDKKIHGKGPSKTTGSVGALDSDSSGDDKCRSLYSLAVVRYLNHISHLATKEMGENAPTPMIQLASHLNVPDWIVDLRHEVSHGSTLPSLEVLRLAADFMKSWLQDNYWIDLNEVSLTPGTRAGADILKTKAKEPATAKTSKNPKVSKEEKYEQVTRAISGYLACGIYKLRNVKNITDPEITHHLPNQPWKVTPKQAMGLFKTKLANAFTTDPFLVCTAFSFEIIPSDDFITSFAAILELPLPVLDPGKVAEANSSDPDNSDNSDSVFAQLCELLEPLTDLIQRRNKVPQMVTLLTSMYTSENPTKYSKLFCAMWLDFFLKILMEDEKKYPARLKKILATVLAEPDPVGKIFFPRLLQLLENNLGPAKIIQLEKLFNIWVDGGIYRNENNLRKGNAQSSLARSRFGGSLQLFTVEHINGDSSQKLTDNLRAKEKNSTESATKPLGIVNKDVAPLRKQRMTSNWDQDVYSENYWRNIPLGGPA